MSENEDWMRSLRSKNLAVFSIRVPPVVYAKYDSLSSREKRMVLKIIREFIISLLSSPTPASGSSEDGKHNYHINIELSKICSEAGAADDGVFMEKAKVLERKLRTAEELLQEYRKAVENYDKIKNMVTMYRNNKMDAKMLFNNILNMVK